jgi:hypothetical protein
MTIDSLGNVLFCDALTNTIRKYWVNSKNITTIAGGGKINGFGQGDKEGYAYLSLIMAPIDITVDEYDNIYFTDGNQFVFLTFLHRKSGGLTTVLASFVNLQVTVTVTKTVIFL